MDNIMERSVSGDPALTERCTDAGPMTHLCSYIPGSGQQLYVAMDGNPLRAPLRGRITIRKAGKPNCLAGKRPIQAFLCSLPWWLKVDRRFDSPIDLFGSEENFRLRSHCPG
jgi:hypothetical protein